MSALANSKQATGHHGILSERTLPAFLMQSMDGENTSRVSATSMRQGVNGEPLPDEECYFAKDHEKPQTTRPKTPTNARWFSSRGQRLEKVEDRSCLGFLVVAQGRRSSIMGGVLGEEMGAIRGAKNGQSRETWLE